MKRRGKFQKQADELQQEEEQKNKYEPPTMEELDEIHFTKRMEIVKKIHNLRDSGMSEEDVCSKMCAIWARSVIIETYRSTYEQMMQQVRDLYGNQSLGKSKVEEKKEGIFEF